MNNFMNLDQLLNEASYYGIDCRGRTEYWLDFLDKIQSNDVIDQLKHINKFVNRLIRYETDEVVWNSKDYWASPLETLHKGMGDCEDIALLKFMSLLMLGHAEHKVRMHYVSIEMANSSISHMVCGYHLEENDPYILDSTIDSVRMLSARSDIVVALSFNQFSLWVNDILTPYDPKEKLSLWRKVTEQLDYEFGIR